MASPRLRLRQQGQAGGCSPGHPSSRLRQVYPAGGSYCARSSGTPHTYLDRVDPAHVHVTVGHHEGPDGVGGPGRRRPQQQQLAEQRQPAQRPHSWAGGTLTRQRVRGGAVHFRVRDPRRHLSAGVRKRSPPTRRARAWRGTTPPVGWSAWCSSRPQLVALQLKATTSRLGDRCRLHRGKHSSKTCARARRPPASGWLNLKRLSPF